MDNTIKNLTISKDIKAFALKGIKVYCTKLISKIEQDAGCSCKMGGTFSKSVYESMPDVLNSTDLCELVGTYMLEMSENPKTQCKKAFIEKITFDLANTIKTIRSLKRGYIANYITNSTNADYSYKMQLFINSVVKGVNDYRESLEHSLNATENVKVYSKKLDNSITMHGIALNS